MADSFGLKIGLEGEKEFKKALSEINQSFKVLGSEMKLATSQFDKNDKSVDALTARNKVLRKEIDEQTTKIETLRKALQNAADSFGENDRRTQNWQIQLNNAEAALNDMNRELDENEEAIKKGGEAAEDSGSKFENFGKILKTVGAAMGAVAVAAGAAAVKLGKEVIAAYADYEQLVGGVDTLFKDSSQEIQRYAANAYKTAGLSANDYMETVTGFSTSLIQSLGGDTEKAVKYADMAITDMSDNANKMGTDMYVYSKYSIAWSDFGTNGTSYIGTATSGVNCFTFTNGQSGSGTKWLVENKQVTVSHNSNGTLTLPIYWHWGVNSPWGQYTGPSGSYNVTLTTIDRAAPTVTFTVSAITANGFKISANSTATSDIWQYSTNGGSGWTQFSTTAGTSASITLSSLSPNTSYTVKVRARRQYNQVYGTSGSSTVKTLGGAVVNSVSTVTADNARVTITLNVTVYEPSYINSLAIKSGNTTILTVTGLAWTKGTANRSVTLSSAQRTTLLNWMASMKSFTATFAVSSFSGSTQIGSTSSKTATVLTTATNSAPTISGFTYADSYTTTKNLTGNDQLFVQDYSTLKVTPGTATAKNGASISNYTASCNGLSASNSTGAAITVGKIAKSGSVTVTLSVTDSRGYTAETSQTVTVIPYTKPKISSITLRRTNDIEAEMQLKFSGSISAVTVDGTQKNSVVYVRYRYKKTSESSYGSYTSIVSGTTRSGTSFSYSNLELCSLDANSSYDFHLQIQDKLYSLSSLDLYFTVPQGTPLIALRKKKVGINTPDPQATLDVDGSIHMNGVNVHGKMGRVDGSTTDLNNVKTPGYYFTYSASTAKHFPTTTIGMLEDFLPESYFIQLRYTVYDGSRMYIRGNYGGTWSSWHTVSLTTVT